MQKVLGDCALCYLFSKMLAVLIRKKKYFLENE